MASQNPSPPKLYPEVIDSNPESSSPFITNTQKNKSSYSMYPTIDMKDLAENLFPETENSQPNQNSNFVSLEEVIVQIPGAIVHLIDKERSIELASGEFEIVQLKQGDNVVAVLARVGDQIQWPLARDEAAVKLDESHYFFTLRVPSEANDEDGYAENLLNYGLTIASKGQERVLKELDLVLEKYSAFRVEKVKKDKGVAEKWWMAPKDVSPEEMEKKKEDVERSSAAYWTTLAPNVEDYLDDFRHVRQEEVRTLTRALANAGQNPIKLGELLNVCTTNALARVMLGKRVFADGTNGMDPQAEEFKLMVVEMMVLAGVFNIGDFIPALDWMDIQGVAGKMKKLHARFDAFLTTILEEHKEKRVGESKEQGDLLNTLISLKNEEDDNGGKLTDTEIKALLLNLFIAGTDTSSSTVEWAIAELIRNPKILAQAQQEIDKVVGKNRLVMESDLAQLTYLEAIVKETFRLHPSTPLSLPRIASESCEINGYFIPKGSTLLVNVWAIARDPNEWADPLEFRPERFLPGGEKPKVDVKGNDFEVIPFGAGRRICPGMSLGIRMVQLMTATLIHSFNWLCPLDNCQIS